MTTELGVEAEKREKRTVTTNIRFHIFHMCIHIVVKLMLPHNETTFQTANSSLASHAMQLCTLSKGKSNFLRFVIVVSDHNVLQCWVEELKVDVCGVFHAIMGFLFHQTYHYVRIVCPLVVSSRRLPRSLLLLLFLSLLAVVYVGRHLISIVLFVVIRPLTTIVFIIFPQKLNANTKTFSESIWWHNSLLFPFVARNFHIFVAVENHNSKKLNVNYRCFKCEEKQKIKEQDIKTGWCWVKHKQT